MLVCVLRKVIRNIPLGIHNPFVVVVDIDIPTPSSTPNNMLTNKDNIFIWSTGSPQGPDVHFPPQYAIFSKTGSIIVPLTTLPLQDINGIGGIRTRLSPSFKVDKNGNFYPP